MPLFWQGPGGMLAGFFQSHRCSGIEVVRSDWLFQETRHYFRSKRCCLGGLIDPGGLLPHEKDDEC